jgi:hypothetical protein
MITRKHNVGMAKTVGTQTMGQYNQNYGAKQYDIDAQHYQVWIITAVVHRNFLETVVPPLQRDIALFRTARQLGTASRQGGQTVVGTGLGLKKTTGAQKTIHTFGVSKGTGTAVLTDFKVVGVLPLGTALLLQLALRVAVGTHACRLQ